MKIGILTFWWAQDNYGQLLQCYALQKYLRDMGHEAFLIRYDYQNDVKKSPLIIKCFKAFNPVKLFRYFAYKKHNADVLLEQQKNNRQFDEFRAKYIVSSDFYASYVALKNNPPQADAYIVGSDQVWNYWYANIKRYNNSLHAYFLDFGNSNTKRLSYAASWGVRELPQDFIQAVNPLLARFNYIGVREESGVDLCRQCGRADAEWVCDPTLLLNADTYRKIYEENAIRKPEKKYLLLYMLNNTCDFDIQSVYDFASNKQLEVVYVTGNGVIDNRQKYFATIPEWLYLVDNAEYVVTNSFHCGVFSTIFHKSFGIVPLSGKLTGMNARFESLFELRGTGKRFVTDEDFSALDRKYKTKSVGISENFLKSIQSKK